MDSKVNQPSSFLIPFTIWNGCGEHLIEQDGDLGHRDPILLSSSPGADMSIENEREVPDGRSFSPLPGRQGIVENVPIAIIDKEGYFSP